MTQQQTLAAAERNVLIDAFTMLHQSSYRHIQAVMNNLQLIILDYLAANLDWRRDFCDWFINKHWEVTL